ncbi:MAG: ATP-binding protein [Myxococcales bacterium]|nr:ATP-binding protein [Myxococcales bacterium]MDH3842356.1 ATP-binding protein [Myxococcales bacterium]
MIRRYTVLGGFVALIVAGLYAYWQATAPGARSWVIIAIAVVIGAVAGWLVSRRDMRDIERLQGVVDAMVGGDFGARVRMRRPGPLGHLGRSLDALGERLSLSERKKHSRKERLGTILDAMSEAVLVTDSGGRISLSNEVLKRWVGLDVEGKTAVEAIRHPDFHVAIEGAQQGISSVLEMSLDDVDGGRRSLRASVAPLENRRGVVCVLSDVTAEREADRVRRDFVANAGHELRTPLTAIRGFAETLRQSALDDPESAHEFLDIILRHTERLQALVDDLADLSRLEGEELKLELGPVAPGALLDEVVRGLEAQARAKDLRIACFGLEKAPRVLAEERALEQVLVNLVDNAIKYTPPGGEIRISIADEANGALIEVANTGLGIPAKHLHRIFERFYRVDAGRSRELGGTGLGLSIVKHLVAKLGGGITVDSREGWTRFSLRLRRPDSPKSDTRVSHG